MITVRILRHEHGRDSDMSMIGVVRHEHSFLRENSVHMTKKFVL